MNKLFSFLAVGVLLIGAAFTSSAPAQAPLNISGCRDLNIENYISVNIRNFNMTGNSGVFLFLPDDIATVPNGGVIQPGKAFVMTDIRMEFTDSSGGQFELVEADQGGTFDRVLLQERSMLKGWQSSVGVIARGDRAPGMGLMLRALDPSAQFTLDIEIVGYVRDI
jgi:hypothetical protein